jgi:hypothetical protein
MAETTVRIAGLREFDSWQGKDSHFSAASRRALGPILQRIQRVSGAP